MDSSSFSPDITWPAIDETLVNTTLNSPPFVLVEGVINIRDFGARYLAASRIVKPAVLFRSGEPSRITSRGVDSLRVLGVRKVFDLRADVEISKYNTPNAAIEGVEFVRVPILDDAFDPVGIAERLKTFATSESEAFLKLYIQILLSGGPAFEVILTHLRDAPDVPCLLHCTAGKDRTGVFAAVILMLLGASDDDITKDYTLTTYGLRPALPLLAARFQKDHVYRDNWAGTVNMSTAKPQSIQNIMKYIHERFGGVEGYLKTHTSLREEDFARIRENLLVPVQFDASN
ncbi:uncharacterized protein LAESUDRAFT_540086 [Laetiporus sulphureus 93-53]|uniref:Tyrosine specific protein phosphatases domain-containing protein n=1 Tax=Laetiporus sulphureus 93-53 TaxID=1314785 RepID=A0A165FLJ2_9APHY|nr:uncharacterized protein LAESUDRAFT_540086 [Laetiporus sulphureus 93-53]KZT09151.1 hypothetical protein LAESUDRAFT_540086 [Laetiporus sulphureus 93-53]